MKNKLLLILALCIIVPSASYAAKKKPKTCGAETFETCPAKGCGGDPLLNQRKNTKVQPTTGDVETVTRGRFAKLKFPKSWKSGTPRKLLEDWGEGTAVEYETFLITTKHYPSGMESCNCNLKKEEKRLSSSNCR